MKRMVHRRRPWTAWCLGGLAAGAALVLTGCPPPLGTPPDARTTVAHDAHVIRSSPDGPVLLVFCDAPLDPRTPPDGVRRAAMALAEQTPALSAAAFYQGSQRQGEKWMAGELARRRARGISPRAMLAGAGVSGTAASEAAWRLLREQPDVVIDLLVTVDAVKTGTVARTAGIATAAIKTANPIPVAKVDTIAYENAPRPDGVRLRVHTNYYQTKTKLLHGAPMPGATLNHAVEGPGGTVNHGNVDDYAYPMMLADFERAARGGVGRGVP